MSLLVTARIYCKIKFASFGCDERLFHSPGPAATNALSPKVMHICVITRLARYGT